jgi:hypothetical protein
VGAEVIVMVWELPLPGRIDLHDMRDWLRQRLSPMREGRLGEVLLVANELVTNAYVHTRCPHWLRLRRIPAGVRVEVADCDPAPPRLITTPPHRPHGHGIHLITQLSTRWGTNLDQMGKIVWAELSQPAT